MDNLLEKIEQAEESALALLPGYKISITNKQGRYIVDMRYVREICHPIE